MYPLHEDYKPLIIEFVKALRMHDEVRVETNGVSTQLYGLYDDVMYAINTEVKQVFARGNKVSMVMKVINEDLSGPIGF